MSELPVTVEAWQLKPPPKIVTEQETEVPKQRQTGKKRDRDSAGDGWAK